MDSLAELRNERRPLVVPTSAGARLLGLALDSLAPATWEPPEILAWSSWVARCFETLQLEGSALTGASEFLLTQAQEAVLWQRALAAEGAPEQAATLARDAWRIAHEWRLPWQSGAALVEAEDVYAFRRWSAAYVTRSDALRASDEARFIAAMPVGSGRAVVRMLGFIERSPVIDAICGATQVAPGAADAAAFSGRAYADRADEFSAALDWATVLSAHDASARVVIALDSLQQDQVLLERCLREHFGSVASTAVHLSVRQPLAQVPSMQSLLNIIELSPLAQWDALSAFTTCRHIADADGESAARACHDAMLREQGRYELPLALVEQMALRAVPACPSLASQLGALQALLAQTPRRQSLNGWLGHFERCLQACGWPGPLVDDNERRRALAGWSDLRDRLQRLDAVLAPLTLVDARSRLRQALAEAVAPALATESSIYITTPKEACLLAPTHLWLAGVESNALGPQSRPSPLLPFAEQRAAGVPGSDPAGDLRQTRRLLGWLAAGSGQRIASYCSGDGDQVFSPNPLIPALRGLAATPSAVTVPLAWRQGQRHGNGDTGRSCEVQLIADEYGPRLPPTRPLTGGVSVLAAQAACPFRAFARHRLRAAAVAEPLPGLDSRSRGSLVHRVLAFLWAQLGDQASLLATEPAALQNLIGQCVARAEILPPHTTPLERELAAVERVRVANLLADWLVFEAARPPFTVCATEQAASVEFEGLALNIRIDRLERDTSGRETIVDYKTGACRENAWYATRMDEPQLPFYALTSESSRLGAIAFARVNSVDPKWISLPRARSETAAEDWQDALAAWGIDLAALAAEIRAGLAVPAPKHGAASCRLCELPLMCRLAERGYRAGDSDADDESADDDD